MKIFSKGIGNYFYVIISALPSLQQFQLMWRDPFCGGDLN